MRTSMLVLVLAVAGCGADTATVEEACLQLAHCNTLGMVTLDECAARYTAAGWSGECFAVIAGTACQDMTNRPWMGDCAEPCYDSGEVRCTEGLHRESCLPSIGGLYWSPGAEVNCDCEPGEVGTCDPANPNACTCDPA